MCSTWRNFAEPHMHEPVPPNQKHSFLFQRIHSILTLQSTLFINDCAFDAGHLMSSWSCDIN